MCINSSLNNFEHLKNPVLYLILIISKYIPLSILVTPIYFAFRPSDAAVNGFVYVEFSVQISQQYLLQQYLNVG